MTVLEMHTAVYLGLDKSSSFQVAAFEPEDVDYWLNEAQLELVKQKMFGNNVRKEGFDSSVKRMEDLTPLVKSSSYDTFGSHDLFRNVKYVSTGSISLEYMFFVNASCDISTGTKTGLEEAKLVSHADIRNLTETNTNTPYLRHPYVFLQNKRINIILDPYATLNEVYVTYVAKPKTLVRENASTFEVTTSELPEQVHPEIVALAVSLMLENIEADRFKSNMVTLNNKE